jgi:molecular chaperone HscB
MTTCTSCRRETVTPLVCTACGALLAPERPPTPFEVFGLAPSLTLDATLLRRRLLELSRRMHPDYFASGGDELRALAERNTAELNRAHESLANELSRADWLVRAFGGPDEKAERSLPQPFLLEVLEWNETLEELRGTPAASRAPEKTAALRKELAARRAEALALLRAALEPLPAHGSPKLADARRELNALRYLDRALDELAALELDQATTHG